MNIRTVLFRLRTIAIPALFPFLAWAAVDPNGNQIVSLTEPFDLSVKQPRVDFVIPYPTDASNPSTGICNVEIRANGGNVKNLLSQLAFRDLVGGPSQVLLANDLTIRLDYSQATEIFLASFSVETKNGQTLQQAITATLGAGHQLILVGTPCAN